MFSLLMQKLLILSTVLIIASVAETSTQPSHSDNERFLASMTRNVETEAPMQNGSKLHSRRLWPRFSGDDCVKQARADQSQCIPCKKTLPDGTEVNRFQGNCKRDATVLASQLFTPWHFCNSDGSCNQGRLPRWQGQTCWAFNKGDFTPFNGPAGVCAKKWFRSRHMPTVDYARANMAHGWKNVADFTAAYQWSMESRRQWGERPETVMTCEKFCQGQTACGELGDCSCGEECGELPPLAGTPAQSSTNDDDSSSWAASKAVDGDVGSFSHTQEEKNPWWQLDLGGDKAIGIIRLRNRPGTCASRLFLGTGCDWEYGDSSRYDGASQGAQFHVSSESCDGDACSGTMCSKLVVPKPSSHWYEVDCSGVRGRYVSVMLPGDNRILHVTEVKVWEVSSTTTTVATTTTTTITTTSRVATGLAIHSGDTVFLKTRSGSGKYVDVDGGMVQARYKDRGQWQALVIEKKNGGQLYSGDTVYLKGHSGVHIDVTEDTVQARWHDFGQWQSMVIVKKLGHGSIQQGDLVCFRAHTGKMLDVEEDSVKARSPDCGSQQTMLLQKEVAGGIASGDLIHIEAHTGNMLAVEGTAVQARWGNRGLWETFAIENKVGHVLLSGDKLFLRCHTGKMLDVQGTSVQCSWEDRGAWQEFTIETEYAGRAVLPGDTIYLKGHTGNEIEIESAAVQARWPDKGAWQSLKIWSATPRRLMEVSSSDSPVRSVWV